MGSCPSSVQFAMGGTCCRMNGDIDIRELEPMCWCHDFLVESAGPHEFLEDSTELTAVANVLDHVPVHTGLSEGKLQPRPKQRSKCQRELQSPFSYSSPPKPDAEVAFERFKTIWFAELNGNTIAAGDSSGTSICNSPRCTDAVSFSAPDHTLMCPSKPPPDFLVMANGRPDFSGSWLCHAVHGDDIDALMVALQHDWVRRTAAACINYGVNISTRLIEQHGNKLVITVTPGPGMSFIQSFEIDGGEQHTDGPDGTVVLIPRWQHDFVLSVMQSPLDGSPPTLWHQYFHGEDLVVKIIASSGMSGSWHFCRA